MPAASSSESGSASSVNPVSSKPSTPTTTPSSLKAAPPASDLIPTTLAQLKLDAEERNKRENRHMSVLNNHMRENTRALKLIEKERDEAIKQLGSLETQKRQLEEELQPLERKKRQLETQIEVSKKRVSTNEITMMIMEQEDPVGCLKEVAERFGRRLEKPLVLKTEEEVTTTPASSSAFTFKGKRPVRIVRRRGTRPVDSYLVVGEAKLRRQRLSVAEEEALRASIAPTPSQNHSDTKQAASE